MRLSCGVARRETSTLSADGHSWLRVLIWLPDPTYTRRGIVQIIHGMSEHIGRYDVFARFLADLGYVVFGHDHIGHGKSVSSVDELGHMPLVGGKEILIEDVKRVRKAVLSDTELRFVVRSSDKDLPFFLLGHSMGSYLARVIAAREGSDLAGVVLCGTGNQPSWLAKVGYLLSRGVGALKGERYRSSFIHSLVVGSFVSAIEDAKSEYDWLSTDQSVVDAYLADPLSGAHFTVGGYATLTDLVSEATSKSGAEGIAPDLPLLFVSGEDDPVGAMGKGVRKAAKLYEDAGSKDIKVILYPGMRHEVLNEPDHIMVFSEIESWLTKRAVLRDLAV